MMTPTNNNNEIIDGQDFKFDPCDSWKDFLRCSNESKYLEKIHDCRDLQESILKVEFDDIINYSNELAQFTKEHPRTSAEYAEEWVKDILHEDRDIKIKFSYSDRIKRSLNCSDIAKLVTVEGIIVSVYEMKHRMTMAHFECEFCHTVNLIPQYSFSLQKPEKCCNRNCKNKSEGNYSVLLEESEYEDLQKVILEIENQQILIQLKNENCNSVNPHDIVRITGIPTLYQEDKDSNEGKIIVIADSINMVKKDEFSGEIIEESSKHLILARLDQNGVIIRNVQKNPKEITAITATKWNNFDVKYRAEFNGKMVFYVTIDDMTFKFRSEKEIINYCLETKGYSIRPSLSKVIYHYLARKLRESEDITNKLVQSVGFYKHGWVTPNLESVLMLTDSIAEEVYTNMLGWDRFNQSEVPILKKFWKDMFESDGHEPIIRDIVYCWAMYAPFQYVLTQYLGYTFIPSLGGDGEMGKSKLFETVMNGYGNFKKAVGPSNIDTPSRFFSYMGAGTFPILFDEIDKLNEKIIYALKMYLTSGLQDVKKGGGAGGQELSVNRPLNAAPAFAQNIRNQLFDPEQFATKTRMLHKEVEQLIKKPEFDANFLKVKGKYRCSLFYLLHNYTKNWNEEKLIQEFEVFNKGQSRVKRQVSILRFGADLLEKVLGISVNIDEDEIEQLYEETQRLGTEEYENLIQTLIIARINGNPPPNGFKSSIRFATYNSKEYYAITSELLIEICNFKRVKPMGLSVFVNMLKPVNRNILYKNCDVDDPIMIMGQLTVNGIKKSRCLIIPRDDNEVRNGLSGLE